MRLTVFVIPYDLYIWAEFQKDHSYRTHHNREKKEDGGVYLAFKKKSIIIILQFSMFPFSFFLITEMPLYGPYFSADLHDGTSCGC